MLNVISYITHIKVNAFAWTDCKLTFFMWYFFHHYSSALLVMMSIEKCIVIYFPFKTKNICTVRTAKLACLIAGIIYAAFDAQKFFIVTAHQGVDYIYCGYTGVSDEYIATYFRIDSALYSLAPFAIMCCTNIAIIYKFIKAKMALKRGTESTNQALSKSAMRGTAILITVSITFLILTGPSAIYYLLTTDVEARPTVRLLFLLMEALNHSINSVMYCIIGTRFRKELFELICCRKKSSGRSSKEIGSTQQTAMSTISTNYDVSK